MEQGKGSEIQHWRAVIPHLSTCCDTIPLSIPTFWEEQSSGFICASQQRQLKTAKLKMSLEGVAGHWIDQVSLIP